MNIDKKHPMVLVFSHEDFDKICLDNGWTDENVEKLNNFAFISINCNENTQKVYLKEKEEHFFKFNHNNVINLEFDDVGSEEFTYNGTIYYGINISQSEELFNFIEENIGKTFIIHCRAGKSRSQAVCRYILDCYGDTYSEKNINLDNPCITPNYHVVTMLKKIYYEKKL